MKRPTQRTKATQGKRALGNSGLDIVGQLDPAESATVLRAILNKYPDLRNEINAIAREVVSSPSVETIAEDVLFNVTSLDMDDLHGRSGNHSWGYAEPTEAAWELLEEAVSDEVAEMKKWMEFGLESAAEAICTGIVIGLSKSTGSAEDSVLGWAPDFPAEEAGYVIEELIRACPIKERTALRVRLASNLSNLVPEWADMFSRIIEDKTHEE